MKLKRYINFINENYIIGGGRMENGKMVDIGDGYRVPHIDEFTEKIKADKEKGTPDIQAFKYERIDCREWYETTYDKYQRNDVILLLKQNRIRVKI